MTKLLPLLIAAAWAALPAGSGVAAAPGEADSASAYTALRAMGKTLGADALNRVVEVTGRDGRPQPATWRIVIGEGGKGLEEVNVSGGRIVSRRAISGASAMKIIRLQDLNLDSSGAFDATDTQARKTHVRFDAVNYTLRVSATTGKPVWDLELMNQTGAHVGGVRLAAHDGNLLSMNGLIAGEPAPAASTPPALVSATTDHDSVRPVRVTPNHGPTTTTTTNTTVVQTNPPPPREGDERRDESSAPGSEEGGFFTRAGHTLDRTTQTVGDGIKDAGRTVDHHVRRAGATVQRFFTGHSDLDQPADSPRD